MLIPAPSPKNPSFVFIRLRTLSFSVYNIFPFKRFAFNPFRTLSRNGGWVSTLPKVELDTQHSSPSNLFKFFLFTLLHTLWRNGRNTTLLESIRSALFLSQWGCGGYAGTFQHRHVSMFALLQFRRRAPLPAIWSLLQSPLCSPRCTPGTRVRPSSPPCSAPFRRPTESLREQMPAFSDRTG